MRFIRNASPEVKAALIIAIGGIIAYTIYATLPIILRQPVPGNTLTPTVTSHSTPSTTITQSTVEEQQTFPLTDGLNGFRTNQTYVGTLTLMVSGTGQAKQTAFSDPLYIYTDFNGNMITPYHVPNFSLCITYKPVDHYLQTLPDYSPTHTYTFKVTIPAPRDHLIFGICDDGVAYNTGSFTVAILQ